jgi:hypothetical protein
MFIKYENKSVVYDYLKMNNMKYYIVNYTKEFMDYVNILPTKTYTTHTYSDVDRKFVENIGFNYNTEDKAKEIYDHVMNYINHNDKLQTMKYAILPFISDQDLFKYCISIVTTRTYKSTLKEYQVLFNIDPHMTSEVIKNKQSSFDNDPNTYGLCLVPFVDFCSHKNPTRRDGKDQLEFKIIYKPNEVKFCIAKSFKEGEEYVYSYTRSSGNEKLLFSYGFYIENNPHSVASSYIYILKKFFPRSKHDLAVRLKCVQFPFIHFYEDNSRDHADFKFYFNQYEINNNVLDLIRLYFLPTENLEPEQLFKRLSKKKWISYENEVLALTYYRGCLVFHFEQFPIKKVYNK